MKRIMSALAFALPLALLLQTATGPARAEDNNSTKPNEAGTVEVYKQGGKYIVAVFQPDGSAVVSLVEAAHVKTNKASGQPDIADLIRRGQVKYVARLAPSDAAEAKSFNLSDLKVPTAETRKRDEFKRLTRKERVELIKEAKVKAQVMSTIGQGLNQNLKDGEK